MEVWLPPSNGKWLNSESSSKFMPPKLFCHGIRDSVKKQFEPELASATVPYSIGVHRVLAQVAVDAEAGNRHIDAIRSVAFDETSEFRVHAIESLAKLGEYRDEDRPAIERIVADVDDGTAAFAKWLVALSKEANDQDRLAQSLRSADPLARLRTAYAITRTAEVSDSTKTLLAETLESEPLDSIARVYLIVAVLRPGPSDVAGKMLDELQKHLQSDKVNEVFHAGMMIGHFGDVSMVPALKANLNAAEPDAKIGAADGMLRLLRREGRAKGSKLWDIDGHEYIDYHTGFAPYILGHNDDDQIATVTQSMAEGLSNWGPGPTCNKGELAKHFLQAVPHADKVQFLNTGSHATSQTIRVARGATGRAHIIKMKGGYNGRHNMVAANVLSTKQALGGQPIKGDEYPLVPLTGGITLQEQALHTPKPISMRL